MNLLAIEIGGSKLQVFAGTHSGEITQRITRSVDRARGGAGIREEIATALTALIPAHRPGAIGVGYGGPVDWKTGRITCSHHVEGWSDFPLGAWLREQSGLPVFVDNDANVAALGEATHGAGRGASPVFWFNCGSGVGGGLVAEGRIYHGAPPGEMEFGHMVLRPGSIVENLGSGWAMDRAVRAAVEENPASALATHAARETSAPARALVPALTEGCPVAARCVEKVAADLGHALSHAVHLLSPEVIVFGGGLSLIGEPLRAAIDAAMRPLIMDAMKPGPRLLLAALKEDAVPVGALALAAQQLKGG